PPLHAPAPCTTELSPLSLHDALPISNRAGQRSAPTSLGLPAARPGFAAIRPRPTETVASPAAPWRWRRGCVRVPGGPTTSQDHRSEEHTSELQSRENLVCRLLLEKKK